MPEHPKPRPKMVSRSDARTKHGLRLRNVFRKLDAAGPQEAIALAERLSNARNAKSK